MHRFTLNNNRKMFAICRKLSLLSMASLVAVAVSCLNFEKKCIPFSDNGKDGTLLCLLFNTGEEKKQPYTAWHILLFVTVETSHSDKKKKKVKSKKRIKPQNLFHVNGLEGSTYNVIR